MQVIELEFTTLELHDNYVVGRTKRGVHLRMIEHQRVLDVLNQHLTAPYGLIIDELNSYSVDFDVMRHISNDENIKCIAVIYYRLVTKIALEGSKLLVKKPLYFSKDRNSVTDWVLKKMTT